MTDDEITALCDKANHRFQKAGAIIESGRGSAPLTSQDATRLFWTFSQAWLDVLCDLAAHMPRS
jgi:hypothetical protein